MTKRMRSRFAQLVPGRCSGHRPAGARAGFAADPPKLELRKGRPDHPDRQHAGRADAILRPLRDLTARRFPELELVVHNLGYSADELTSTAAPGPFRRPRPHAQGREARRLVAAFGFNESFAGPAGLGKFKNDLEKFIKDSTTTKYNGKEAPEAGAALADRP